MRKFGIHGNFLNEYFLIISVCSDIFPFRVFRNSVYSGFLSLVKFYVRLNKNAECGNMVCFRVL